MVEDRNEIEFDAVSTCVSFIYRVLHSLSSVSKRAEISISSQGITVSAEAFKACQAHAFLDKSFFSSYLFNPVQRTQTADDSDGQVVQKLEEEEEATESFSLQLDALVECFQIFSSDVQDPVVNDSRRTRADRTDESRQLLSSSSLCKLQYRHIGDPFIVMLDEGTLVTTCEFTTSLELDGEDGMTDIILSTDQLQLSVILHPQPLYEAFRDLDAPGSETVLTVNAAQTGTTFQTLELITQSELGSFAWTVGKDRNVIDSFVMPELVDRVYRQYNYKLVQRVREAVKLATMISFRIDHEGIMSIQSLCDIGDGRKAYIDFRFLPLHADDLDDLPPARSQRYIEHVRKMTQKTDFDLFSSDEEI
ncbi:Rad1/Rec1/Rad17 [Lipomyces oligophaga]|uniref:Rad1/Rec1/Rad17 n=1 Tax=Lipomyces oligophaga TaxID=45792 RepID=UPI0034CF69E8